MKKFIFILICALSIGFSTSWASSYAQPSNDASACVNVGNVSANIDGSQVKFSNSNGYTVTVEWTVYGHRKDGSKFEVGGGTVVLGRGNSGTKDFTKSDEYTSYSVKINTQKCD